MTAPSLASRARTERDAYADHVYGLWMRAEDVTHGYMINELGRRKGLTGFDLYAPGQGRAPVSYASTELREAWDRDLAPRPMSWREFKATNREPEPASVKGRAVKRLLDLRGLAERAGINYTSARTYRSRPGALPDPDFLVGEYESPAWLPETVDKWVAARRTRAVTF